MGLAPVSISGGVQQLCAVHRHDGGPLVCLLLYIVWWLFFSRLQGRERWLVPVIAIAAAAVAVMLVQKKVGTAVWTYGIPVCMTVLTAWLTNTRKHQPEHFRTTALLAACCWFGFLAVRLEGFDGSYLPELRWRWTPTSEEELLAADQGSAQGTAQAAAADYTLQPSDWPTIAGRAATAASPA